MLDLNQRRWNLSLLLEQEWIHKSFGFVVVSALAECVCVMYICEGVMYDSNAEQYLHHLFKLRLFYLFQLTTHYRLPSHTSCSLFSNYIDQWLTKLMSTRVRGLTYIYESSPKKLEKKNTKSKSDVIRNECPTRDTSCWSLSTGNHNAIKIRWIWNVLNSHCVCQQICMQRMNEGLCCDSDHFIEKTDNALQYDCKI